MDYYQGVVADYLSADPAMFVKPECCIQLSPGPLVKGEHWYCDIVVASLRDPATVYLCEVTLSRRLTALLTRLQQWNERWPAICAALVRDNHVPEAWRVRPWAFVPRAQMGLLSHKLDGLSGVGLGADRMPLPLATALEDVAPWLYSPPHQLPGEATGDA